METTLAFALAYGRLGGLYLAATIAAVVWIGFGLSRPLWLILPVLLVLAVFPASSVLIAEGGLGFDIYGKGSGYLVLSVYEITIVMAAATLMLGAFGSLRTGPARLPALPQPGPRSPALWPWYAGFAVLMVGWGLHYALQPESAALLTLSRNGILYLVLQGLLVAAVVGCIRQERDLQLLVTAVAVAVTLRMVWGLVRYLFLGGDPANYYETATNPFRITFWDINDSIWAAMLACAAIWTAATHKTWSTAARTAALAVAVLCLVIAALSARRTAQGGMLMALVVLFILLPRGRRWWVGTLFVLLVPVVAYKLQTRLEDNRTLLQKMFTVQDRPRYLDDPRYERFYELRVAAKTIERHLPLGVGPAGRFEPPSHAGLEYHQGNYGFVHSGFVHVLLKTGLVGLALFAGLLLAWARSWHRQWRSAPEDQRGLLVASAAAFAAGLPNLAFGTPFIELRTSLLMGLGFAIPLLVARLTQLRAAPAAPVVPPIVLGRLYRSQRRSALGRT